MHSIADVLRLTAAVDVRARGERGVQTDFAVRGANFGQMLVLVDGVRLNDAQSGHHNGDIPVPLDAMERIEILHGAGSSIFGADAFGGTVNVITRKARSARIGRGRDRQLRPRCRARTGRRRARRGARSARGGGRSLGRFHVRARLRHRRGQLTDVDWRAHRPVRVVSVEGLWRERVLRAMRRRTNGRTRRCWPPTIALAARAGWQFGATGSYRTHGDHFLFDVQPAGRVREPPSDARRARGAARVSRAVGSRGSVTTGVEGGADWVRSTQPWRSRHAARERVCRVAVRAGGAAPSSTPACASIATPNSAPRGVRRSAVGWWPSDVVRLRASAGRAFRVPTFTERYYSGPRELCAAGGSRRDGVGRGGGCGLSSRGRLDRVARRVFGRQDHDVIDWLRPTTADRWRTYNIRDVDTVGAEFSRQAGVDATAHSCRRATPSST